MLRKVLEDVLPGYEDDLKRSYEFQTLQGYVSTIKNTVLDFNQLYVLIVELGLFEDNTQFRYVPLNFFMDALEIKIGRVLDPENFLEGVQLLKLLRANNDVIFDKKNYLALINCLKILTKQQRANLYESIQKLYSNGILTAETFAVMMSQPQQALHFSSIFYSLQLANIYSKENVAKVAKYPQYASELKNVFEGYQYWLPRDEIYIRHYSKLTQQDFDNVIKETRQNLITTILKGVYRSENNFNTFFSVKPNEKNSLTPKDQTVILNNIFKYM